MIPRPPIRGSIALFATLLSVGCGSGAPSSGSEDAIIDPPAQCSSGRPDCSVSLDFPDQSELNPDNSAGLRFSAESGALVLDRFGSLPDADGDGVPDDADDCPGTPDWISCDGDPTNDGLYATLFYDPSGTSEAAQRVVLTTTAEIPKVDIYFLIDATPTLADEILALQTQLQDIVDAVLLEYDDVRFGVGIYRAYPLDGLGPPFSQAPYHHILDLTDDVDSIRKAVDSLNTVQNVPLSSTAATQALFSMATGSGLGDMVPNRGPCTGEGDIGYPCFRENSLRIVMNLTDSEVYNGPRAAGPTYGDPPFDGTVGQGGTTLPPAEMFTELFDADDAMTALDLGDLSGRSLTLLGMSSLLTDQVKTELAPGCAPLPPDPPPVDPDDDPVGEDMDGKDVVLRFTFDASVGSFTASARNTHWPAANVALFDDMALEPAMALACNGGDGVDGMWGSVVGSPTPAQPYYLVADAVIPPIPEPGFEPEGAFSIAIVHDGDPENPSWLTADAPITWESVETALLADDIRVASVVTLRDAMDGVSPGAADARLIAAATEALTGGDDSEPWVAEPNSAAGGEVVGDAIRDTLLLPSSGSVYDVIVEDLDNPDTPIDERDFVTRLRWDYCATDDDELAQCGGRSANRCVECQIDAVVDFALSLANESVPPGATSQVFDFEVLVRLDDRMEIERVPVRVMVPTEEQHEFETDSGPAYYENSYDTTARCNAPPESPKWGDFTWTGTTPAGTAIEFQIRQAASEAELDLATPLIVEVSADNDLPSFNIRDALIANDQVSGLPFLRITAILKAASNPPTTPTLEGWTFEFFCEPSQ